MASAHIRELNKERIVFEAMVKRANSKQAKLAMVRAINHETAKAHTQVKRVLRDETGIKYGDINSAVKRKRASVSSRRLSSAIIARGGAMPLKYFAARQFRYGVRAKPWNRAQRFDGAFIVKTLSGHVFKRSGKKRLPIEMLWGPSLPKEMLREKAVNAFNKATDQIPARAVHEITRIIEG
ncbi:phage tail protein [Paracoccus sp. KR1-242]|uniref:phage tail protein n=1 Tax=Paracoccus sp. KR1-242 TaxID=3410028 RepID=UPI003BFFA1A8